jgi:thiol-disulfide isomerase/thioredoxin
MKTFLISFLTCLCCGIFVYPHGYIQDQDKSITFDEIMKKAENLFNEGKFLDCLQLIDKRIVREPEEKLKFSNIRLNVLKRLGYFKEAINQILEENNGQKLTSGRVQLELGGLYLKLQDIDNAFKWYDIAVDNGFTYYEPFERGDEYKSIRNDIRYHQLIKKMKDNIGIGKPIKDFIQKDINGDTISPALFKNKVLLIDFWATWCAPCMAEMDNLIKIFRDFNKNGFALISINLDEDRNKVDRFVKNVNPPWPIISSGKGWDDETARLYNVKDLPSVWLVDRKGVLRYVHLRGDGLREKVGALIIE